MTARWLRSALVACFACVSCVDAVGSGASVAALRSATMDRATDSDLSVDPAETPVFGPLATDSSESAPTPASPARDEFLGVLVGARQRSVVAATAAEVVGIHVRVGEAVEADAALVSLSSSEHAERLLGARSAHRIAELEHGEAVLSHRQAVAEVERYESLTDLLARADLERRRVERDRADLAVQRARVTLNQTREELAALRRIGEALAVRSPFRAEVVAVATTVGARVANGEPLLRLADLSTVRVRFALPDRALVPVVGQTIVVHRRGNERHAALVDVVPNSRDDASRMFVAEAELTVAPAVVVWGEPVRVTFES